MIILALEFSSEQRSVAVVHDRPGDTPLVLGSAAVTGPRATKALSLIDQALRQANVGRDQVERVVVGLGPGSYTGIRMTIAVAQAWQLARGVALLGLSSAAVMAAQARHAKLWGRIHLVSDAQRNEFYLAVYEVNQAAVVELSPLRLACHAEIEELAAAGALLAGPAAERWLPAGRALFPHAAVLGELSVGRTDCVSGERLEPIYLRETSFLKAPLPRALSQG
jgi:tRNA threonylcarbamoyl adenosine modification protein YeaZ